MNTERAFDFLQRKRCFFWVAMAAMILIFVPHTLPLGITVATVVFGAVFYPPQTVRAAPSDKLKEYLESPQSIVALWRTITDGSRKPWPMERLLT